MESNFKNIYFLGIGGIGMSALARYFEAAGYNIAGYDRQRSDICIQLEELGVKIHYEDSIAEIPVEFKSTDSTFVILTPAIPAEHSELNYFLQNKFIISKRSEVLGTISNPKNGLAIAGTHGKTSVSGICANIMSRTKKSCSAFLGGISKNVNSNLILNPNSDYVVVEADEFDRSFHRLTPSTALITCIEADHLDIYKNFENLLEAFIIFGNKTKQGGNLILNNSISKNLAKSFRSDINIFSYGLNDSDCDFNITNINYKSECSVFDIHYPGGIIKEIKYNLGGNHNLENALAASSIALLNEATENDIREGLETYQGIVRRFDFKIKTANRIYIDDYAHHPGEINACLNAVRLLFPDRKLTAVFQPHLYSRTSDFHKEFAESLSLCDELILLPIYPAREKPMLGVNSEMIYNLVDCDKKQMCEKADLLKKLQELNPELIVTMGAGDIDMFVEPITNLFS